LTIGLFRADHSIGDIDMPSHQYSIANGHVGFDLASLANSDITEVGRLNQNWLS
jgi:hypothetical protein